MKMLQVIPILAAAALLCAQSDSALEKAIRKETLEGDLKGAIESYKKLAQDKNRNVAAKALVHLGECYEKLGDAEARQAYERVVRDFGDQKDALDTAHVRLAVLGKPAGGAGPSVRVINAQSKSFLAAVSPDGRYLLASSNDGLIRRDLATGQTQVIFKGSVGTAVFSSDSNRIALALWRETAPEIWTVATDGREQRKVWQGDKGWRAHVSGWFPDRKRLVVQLQQGRTLSRLITVSTEDGSTTRMWEAPIMANGPLSPDGAYVALDKVSSNPHREELSLFSTVGGGETPILEEFGSIDWQQWTPDGKGLVFLSDRRTPGKSQDLWYLGIGGGKAQGRPQLIKSDLEDASLAGAIARDGTLYYQNSIAMREILVAEVDPSTGKAIGVSQALPGQTEGPSGQPIYSPDGRWIMYRRGAPESSIHIRRNLQTAEEKKLETGFFGSAEQMWFPDSRSVLVNSSRRDSARGFYRMDAVSGSATLLKEGSFGASFAVSPDGKTVYYSQYSPSEGQTRVMAWEIGGGEREVMRGQGYPDVATHWIGLALSPDGAQLATRRTDGQDTVIDIRPVSGTGKREVYRVHAPQVIHELQWAPDGRHLLFSVIQGEQESLCRIPVSGGAAQELGISARSMGKVVVHPDGRHIAFVSVEGGTQIMALEHFLPTGKN